MRLVEQKMRLRNATNLIFSLRFGEFYFDPDNLDNVVFRSRPAETSSLVSAGDFRSGMTVEERRAIVGTIGVDLPDFKGVPLVTHQDKQNANKLVAPYISTVSFKLKNTQGTLMGRSFGIHRALVGSITRILNEVTDSGENFPFLSISAFQGVRKTVRPGGRGYSDTFSYHSWGLAVDINPGLNPYLVAGTTGNYNPAVPGTITTSSAIYKAFIKEGWKWGGSWHNPDYMHFEFPIR